MKNDSIFPTPEIPVDDPKRPFGVNPKFWNELLSAKATSIKSSEKVPDWNDPELYFYEVGKIPVAFYRLSSTLFRVYSGKKLIPLTFRTMYSYVYDSHDFISGEEAEKLAGENDS